MTGRGHKWGLVCLPDFILIDYGGVKCKKLVTIIMSTWCKHKGLVKGDTEMKDTEGEYIPVGTIVNVDLSVGWTFSHFGSGSFIRLRSMSRKSRKWDIGFIFGQWRYQYLCSSFAIGSFSKVHVLFQTRTIVTSLLTWISQHMLQILNYTNNSRSSALG